MTLASTANAGDLERLFAQILRDPHNTELNLQYARLAEARGEDRKALAAYERILEAEPSNREAASALHRLRVNLIPVATRSRVAIGARYESNVRQLPNGAGRTDDVIGFAELSIQDRRPLFDQEWRSDLFAYADLHDRSSEIDYWYARGHTGPVFQLFDDATMQVAPGGSVSFLDGDWYYAEPALRLTFRNLLGGLLARLDVRGGYREVNSDVGASRAFALDVVGRNVNREVFTDSDVLILQPFFRVRESDTAPSGQPVLLNTFVLGDYIEVGGQVLYYLQPYEDLRIGGRFMAYYRDYDQSIRLGTAERHDAYISPGAEVLFRNVVCDGCDLKFDYRYEHNFSNDRTEDFFNHVAGVRAIKRF